MQRYKEEEKNIMPFLKELGRKKRMSFQDITESGLLTNNRNTAHDTLEKLVEDDLVREENSATWKQGQKLWHSITPKGKKWLIKRETENLKKAVGHLRELVEEMLKPDHARRWKLEGKPPLPKRIPVNTDPDAPASITALTLEEQNEMFLHKEKMFGGLRECFFLLAQVVMKVDVGLINAEEDLSNVKVCFWKGRPVWTVDTAAFYRKRDT